jgi:hypothetical protein
MTLLKSMIVSHWRKRSLLPMLLVFSCLSLLLPSCSHEKGGNISNMDGTKTAKSIETEQTASS